MPRAVLYDYYAERGDPRGRRGSVPARRAWLGGLAPFAVARRSRFEGGVLAALALRDALGPAELARAGQERGLCTVRTLELGTWRRAPELAGLWARGRLGLLDAVSAEVPAALALAGVPGLGPLQELTVRAGGGLTPLDAEFLGFVAAGRRLPPAGQLTLQDDAVSLDAPLARALGEALEAVLRGGVAGAGLLAVGAASLDGAGAYLRCAGALGPRPRWGLRWGGVAVWLEQAGARAVLDARRAPGRSLEARLLAAASALRLCGLSPDHLAVRLPPRRALPAAVRRVLSAKALAPARLEVTAEPGVP